MFILNAIPGGIIPAIGGTIKVFPLSWSEFRLQAEIHQATSAIGHEDTAALVSALSGHEVPFNRVSVPTLKPGDRHLLALYQGTRLPEGSTTLPEGASLTPYLLTFS